MVYRYSTHTYTHIHNSCILTIVDAGIIVRKILLAKFSKGLVVMEQHIHKNLISAKLYLIRLLEMMMQLYEEMMGDKDIWKATVGEKLACVLS